MMIKTQIFVVFAAFAALVLGGSAGAATMKENEQTILREVNKVRVAHRLAPLRVDSRLQSAARAHATDMLRRNYFSHAGFRTRMLQSKAAGPRLGENLYWGVGTRASARNIVRAWMASPAHRANLLRPGFRRVGIARAVGRFAGYRNASVVTANFAGR